MAEILTPKKRSLFWPVILILFLLFGMAFFVFILAIIVSAGDGVHFGSRPVKIIKIEGPIMDSIKTLKEMDQAQHDEDIKVVVLRIDSPGGAVGPSQELFQQVLKLKQTKKVIVSMGTVAASGGYYIACAADTIVASPGTITGSIGVIIQNMGFQGILDKLTIEERTIKSGKYKDAGNPFRHMEDFERTYLQAISDDMYTQFVTAVAENRKIVPEKAFELAQGRIYTGKMAKDVGLVDELGNIYDAIAIARKMANLPVDAGVDWPREPGFLDTLASGDESRTLLEWLRTKVSLSALPLTLMQAPLVK